MYPHRAVHLALLSLAVMLAVPSVPAATSLGVREPEPPGGTSAQVPVLLDSTTPAVALQADVLFDPDLFTVTDAATGAQPEGVLLQSRLMEPGRLRVVVHHRSSGAIGNDVIFQVPLTAKSGVVTDDPIVLTDFVVAGQGGGVLATGLKPRVRLVGLRDGQNVNGRLGIELTATAQATGGAVSKVEYYVGGVLLGEGAGAKFAYLWTPPTAGPFEITAVAYDSNGLTASTRTVPVVVTHVGTYVGAVDGTYYGLVRGPQFNLSNDGYVTMTSTKMGKLTLKLLTGGKSLSGSGTFDASGNAVVTIKRTKLPSLTVVLAHSSIPDVDQIHGRVSDGTFSAATATFAGKTFETEFTVDRLVWNATKRVAPQNGTYTLLLPAADNATTTGAPLGTGFGTVTVGKNGSAKITGSLADGATLTASSSLSKDGTWPVYASLYANKGTLLGNLDFVTLDGVSDLDGELTWMRPADAKAPLFKPGFLTASGAVGARYAKPTTNQRMLPLVNAGGNASLFFMDGGLPGDLERLAFVSAGNKATVPLQDADQSTLTLTAATGLFSGTFLHPVTQAKITFKGAALQEQKLMSGYFLAGSQGGEAMVAANADLPPAETDAAPLGTAPLPTVRISSPAAKSTLKSVLNQTVQVKGTASDKNGITAVQCQVLHNGELTPLAAAIGTTSWTYDIAVPPEDGGLYTVYAKAIDSQGNESEVASVQFWTPLKAPLEVTVAGPGKVSTGYLGTTNRDVGKLLTITATPNAKKKFLGWTGSVTSPAPKITVLMKAGTTLQANFGEP